MKYKIDPVIGILPNKPPPLKSEVITLDVDGLPPVKCLSFSLRNKKSPQYDSFYKLRMAGLKAMDGRCWYDGEIKVKAVYYVDDSTFSRPGRDYMGGIMDTLGGSHGFTFTYLPIIYQDDCQPTEVAYEYKQSEHTHYQVIITFL